MKNEDIMEAIQQKAAISGVKGTKEQWFRYDMGAFINEEGKSEVAQMSYRQNEENVFESKN